MKYLHTMVRVSNLEESLAFYCDKLGSRKWVAARTQTVDSRSCSWRRRATNLPR